ncbi:hypothetical protein CEXT_361021 [Caerostris extrusa]|uniref:Uncharacterized protein n=1 Tax=Caerostris extrusa TaxID=172846 RepID=A0AAV4PHV0_CAEEX|nr:hypothetical protein CEXT_361021 [Caerostris extrusa]
MNEQRLVETVTAHGTWERHSREPLYPAGHFRLTSARHADIRSPRLTREWISHFCTQPRRLKKSVLHSPREELKVCSRQPDSHKASTSRSSLTSPREQKGRAILKQLCYLKE